METSILLRRLKARISATKDTRFILTNATLGSDSSVDDDIITFAENLCGVNFDKKYIIRAEREPYVPNATIKKYPDELYKKLADSENFVWQVLNDYGFNVDKATDEKELLYDFLLSSDLYHSLRLHLGGICELSEIGEKQLKTTPLMKFRSSTKKNAPRSKKEWGAFCLKIHGYSACSASFCNSHLCRPKCTGSSFLMLHHLLMQSNFP